MLETNELVARLNASLEHDPRVNQRLNHIQLNYDGDALVLAGEVSSIAAKRLALEQVAALSGLSCIVDRLHVTPAETMGDGAIADHLQRALMSDSAFGFCEVHRSVGSQGRPTTVGQRRSGQPYIEFSVAAGVVTLAGELPSLTHKRLAGVLAWWIPGSRDVINALVVEPPEQDTDAEILDALRVVLEKDPLLTATRIGAGCEAARITLQGVVKTAAERSLAESDAWAIFGVNDVRNQIQVLHP